MSDNKAKAEQLKNTGNTALKAGRLEEAITSYGDAIELDPDNHILYSNRSAAYVTARKYNDALKDAEKTIELKPDWPKGYSRVGAALVGMKRYSDAEEMYRKGLKFEPGNEQLMKGLEEAQKMKEAENNPFNSPDVLNRLLSNPKTAEYMKDPGFVNGIEELGRDHSALQKYLQDKRYIESLGVMLGIDIDTMYDSDIGGDEFIRKDNPLATEREEEKENDDPKTKESTKVPPEPMEVEVDDDSKKKALEEKEKGNASYKKKDFTAAHEHYDRAIQLDPENITILTNKAAVYFEQGNYEDCLKICEDAVEKGREIRADYKLIAKAFARMGNVYFKQRMWADAIKYYDKSLAEHRTQDVISKKTEAQKNLKEEEQKAYVDVDKSLEEKQRGNDLYQQGKFGDAIQCYTEAIKRNPEDARIFSNRAACYHKLAEWHLAIKDCDDCIKLDPTFVKGHIRKGQALLALKEITKAMRCFNKALELDPNNVDATDGLKKCYMQDDPETRRKNAMQDPQIQQIMADPAMQIILQQMQENPGAINDHLKNPEIAAKIEKLMEAGIISFRHM